MLLDEPRADLGGNLMKSGISIKVKQRGKNLVESLRALRARRQFDLLEIYAQKGVEALSAATPVDTGKTMYSWYYEIERNDDYCVIRWNNSNVHKGINIALLIQMDHGTGTGGWIEGRDYINPAIQPVFDEIAEKCWSEVTRL